MAETEFSKRLKTDPKTARQDIIDVINGKDTEKALSQMKVCSKKCKSVLAQTFSKDAVEAVEDLLEVSKGVRREL